MAKLAPDEPHALYRFYGAGGTLLYIGITNEIPRRLKQHNKDKPWWLGVSRIDVEHYPTRHAVLEAERRAIMAEKPLYNQVHNQGAPWEDTHEARDCYARVIREALGDEEMDTRIEDERFLDTPEDLIPLSIAAIALESATSDLRELIQEVDKLFSALPADALAHLAEVAERNRVTLFDPEFRSAFLGTVAEWFAARKQAECGALNGAQ